LIVTVLLLVILGVTIPLTMGTNGVTIPKDATSAPVDSAPAPVDPTSIDPVVTPTQSPTNSNSDRLKNLHKILMQNEVLAAKALQGDDSSPQSRALRWLADDDPTLFDLDSMPTGILVAQYVLALLYFAINGEGWSNEVNCLSSSSVSGWTNGSIGVGCNEDGLVTALRLCKLQHEEVIILIDLSCWHDCHACSHFLAIFLGLLQMQAIML
jgi:hypothetical protein